MSEYLPFWPKAAMTVGLPGGTNHNVYTRALATNGFTEVVCQVQMDARLMDTGGGSSVTIYPQVSNDGVNWKDLTAFTTVIGTGTSVPHQETVKYTEVGAFMRVRVQFSNAGASGVGATLMISGVGRS